MSKKAQLKEAMKYTLNFGKLTSTRLEYEHEHLFFEERKHEDGSIEVVSGEHHETCPEGYLWCAVMNVYESAFGNDGFHCGCHGRTYDRFEEYNGSLALVKENLVPILPEQYC